MRSDSVSRCLQKLPWTMEYMWKKTKDSNLTSSICKLCEPDLHQGSSPSRSYIVEKGIVEGRSNFVDAEVCASRDGWVLFSKEEGKGSLLFFFFSPFTKEVIYLPHLESPGFEVATFSSAPTFPDCVVFVTHPPDSGKIFISIYRPCGDDKTWNVSIFDAPERRHSVESVAYMRGNFYCHFGCFWVTFFNIANKKWGILRFTYVPSYENDVVIDDFDVFSFSNPNYLLECDGELLLAYAANDPHSLYRGQINEECFHLFRLDWKPKAWRHKNALRGGAIFIGKTSFWISREGETENVANMVRHYSRGTPKFFLSRSDCPSTGSLEEHREKCKICYHPCTEGLKTIWIAPPREF